MSQRWLSVSLVVGSALLGLTGCGMINTGPTDTIDASDAVAGTALLKTSWESGNAFVIDKDERLVLTTTRVATLKGDLEVVFPVVADGKVSLNKSAWLSKGKSARTVRAKMLMSDSERELAVLQLDALPAGVPALKLAAATPTTDTTVHFLGASADSNLVWTPMTATVSKVTPVKVGQSSNQMLELTGTGPFAKEVAGGPVVNDANEVVGIIPSTPANGNAVTCLDVSEIRSVLAAAYRDKATVAYAEGKYDEALKYGDKALAAWPEDALGYNERGAAYSQKDQFDKAIADYSKSIELEPGFWLAYRNRGSAYYHSGKYEEALNDLNRAIELDSGYLSAYQTRSKVYAKLNKPKEAEADNKAVAALTDMMKKGKEVPLNWTMTGVTGGGPAPAQNKGFRPPTKDDPYWRGPNGKRYIAFRTYNYGWRQSSISDGRGGTLPTGAPSQ